MTEISNYAKYRVTGPGAEAWLSSLLTARMPAPGRITLTAMLNDAGRIVGEFTVARASEADEFYLFGSLPAEVHHSRWFRHHLPDDGSVRFEVLGLGLVGLSVAGPRSRDVLSAVAPDLDLSTEAFPFMTFRHVDLGMIPVHLARINYAGDLGYELWVAPRVPARAVRPDRGGRRAARPAAVRDAGADVAPAREELRDVVPRVPADLHAARSRDHALHQARPRLHRPRRLRGASWRRAARTGRLVAMVVEPDPDDPADVIGDEPIWHHDEVVGWVTSGGYGHHVGLSIALGYVPDGPGDAGRSGRRGLRDRDHRPAPTGPAPAASRSFDPSGTRMRQ